MFELDVKVLKAFLYDLATTVVTLVVAYLTVPDNVTKLGFGDALVPIVVGLAGAAATAWRRYVIEAKK